MLVAAVGGGAILKSHGRDHSPKAESDFLKSGGWTRSRVGSVPPGVVGREGLQREERVWLGFLDLFLQGGNGQCGECALPATEPSLNPLYKDGIVDPLYR